jgi:hypothetical protein
MILENMCFARFFINLQNFWKLSRGMPEENDKNASVIRKLKIECECQFFFGQTRMKRYIML